MPRGKAYKAHESGSSMIVFACQSPSSSPWKERGSYCGSQTESEKYKMMLLLTTHSFILLLFSPQCYHHLHATVALLRLLCDNEHDNNKSWETWCPSNFISASCMVPCPGLIKPGAICFVPAPCSLPARSLLPSLSTLLPPYCR